MKEFYYLSGKEQNGPFQLEQLKSKNLNGDTLIWTEGMETWKKIKDEKELFESIFDKKSPPPPPIDLDENQLSPKTEMINKNSDANVVNKKIRILTIWLIIWCSFHLFALLMSYSQIDIFNDNGTPRKDKLWPFVEYVNKRGHYIEDKTIPKMQGYSFGRWESEFYGIFNEYDWSEFALYAGGSLVIFFLIVLSNKKKLPN